MHPEFLLSVKPSSIDYLQCPWIRRVGKINKRPLQLIQVQDHPKQKLELYLMMWALRRPLLSYATFLGIAGNFPTIVFALPRTSGIDINTKKASPPRIRQSAGKIIDQKRVVFDCINKIGLQVSADILP